jgi:hypothetical protein
MDHQAPRTQDVHGLNRSLEIITGPTRGRTSSVGSGVADTGTERTNPPQWAQGAAQFFRVSRAEKRSEGETRRVVDVGRMVRRQLQWFVGDADFRLRSREDEARNQSAPFRYLYGFDRGRGRRRQRLTRTSWTSARTRFSWRSRIGVGDRRCSLGGSGRINRHPFDMGWIITTGANRGG